MQPGTLRFLAPFVLTALLAACGGDDSGSVDKSSENSTATKKHDAGTSKKKDAGKPPPVEDTSDDSSDDGTDDSSDGTDDSTSDDSNSKESKDAGKGCTTNADCHGGDAGIGCCDVPTNMCFVSHAAKCPSAVTTVMMQPSYK